MAWSLATRAFLILQNPSCRLTIVDKNIAMFSTNEFGYGLGNADVEF